FRTRLTENKRKSNSNLMKNIFRLLFLLLITGPAAYAQMKVTGSVIDQQSGTPLGYATLQLLKASDKTLASGALTDDDGRFSIDAAPGTYFLVVDFMGYQQLTSEEFTVDKKEHDLGNIQ